MKILYFISGLVLGTILIPAMGDISEIVLDRYPDSTLAEKINLGLIIPRLGFGSVFTKGCTKDVGRNRLGWLFINREYNKCGKIAIRISDLLYGEYANPRDPKLEKLVCKGCTL